MLTTFGNIVQRSQIPPQFVMLRFDQDIVGAIHHYEYPLPYNRDFWVTSIFMQAKPTAPETIQEFTLAIHPIGQTPNEDTLLAAIGPFTAGVAGRLNFPIAEGFLVPRNTIIHGHITFSAGVTAKISNFHLVGWLIKPYDMVLL